MARGFMKLDGVNGSSKDKAHIGWSDIFEWDIRRIMLESGRPMKDAAPDVDVTKWSDAATNDLASRATTGLHYPKVVIEIMRDDKPNELLLKISCTNAVVATFIYETHGEKTDFPEKSRSIPLTSRSTTQTQPASPR